MEGGNVEYSLVMSSMPGLPLEIECHNKDEIELELRVKCDNGTFLVWNTDGAIEEYGRYYYGSFVSTTLYWLPLNDDEIPISTPVEYSIGIYNYEQDKEGNKIYGRFALNDKGKYVVDIN